MQGPGDPFDRSTPLDVITRRHAGGGGRLEAHELPGGASAPNFVVGLPTVERPPSATDFNLFSTLAARNLANSPSVFPASVQIPPANVAVIRSISILANALLVTSAITWALRFSGSAVPGWNALTINPRAAGSVELSFVPDETYIPVPQGSLIDVALAVADAGTYQVSVQIHGWFYNVGLSSLAGAAY